MKSIIIGLVIAMLIVPVSTVIIIEPKILGLGNEQSDLEVDDKAPVSSMHSPRIFIYFNNTYKDSQYCIKSINIYWYGEDNPKGSGVKWYDVQYMTATIHFDPNDCHPAVFPPDPAWYNPIKKSEWQDWQMQTTNTSAELFVETDYIYYFRCRATDNAGNVEDWPLQWDEVTIVVQVENSSDFHKDVELGTLEYSTDISIEVSKEPQEKNDSEGLDIGYEQQWKHEGLYYMGKERYLWILYDGYGIMIVKEGPDAGLNGAACVEIEGRHVSIEINTEFCTGYEPI